MFCVQGNWEPKKKILKRTILTDTRSICWPRLGRHIDQHQPTCMSADTRPILHRHSADTLPTLGQHYAHLLSSRYWVLSSLLNWDGAFSGRRLSVLAFNSGNIHVFFPAMFFSSLSPLYTTLLLSFLIYSRTWASFQFTKLLVAVPLGLSPLVRDFTQGEVTYVFQMAAVWATSSLYRHTNLLVSWRLLFQQNIS